MLLSAFILIVTFTGLIVVINRFSTFEETVPTSNMHVTSAANFSKFLAPIVMHNPDPFNSPKNADKQMKISSSIWHCVMKNGTNTYKNFDERGLTLIPVKEIETSCEELFGPEHGIDFSQSTFGPFFNMESGEKNFHISTISNQDCYLPYIENITQINPSTIKLTVGYVVREDPFFTKSPQKAEKPEPKKYMIYILKKNQNKGEYFLNSVVRCD